MCLGPADHFVQNNGHWMFDDLVTGARQITILPRFVIKPKRGWLIKKRWEITSDPLINMTRATTAGLKILCQGGGQEVVLNAIIISPEQLHFEMNDFKLMLCVL